MVSYVEPRAFKGLQWLYNAQMDRILLELKFSLFRTDMSSGVATNSTTPSHLICSNQVKTSLKCLRNISIAKAQPTHLNSHVLSSSLLSPYLNSNVHT